MRSALGTILNRAPVPYVGRSGRPSLLSRGRNDAEAQMRAFGSVGTLFQIVHRTSNDAAKVEWRLYRPARSGRKEARTEVTSHAALDLWNRPNPFYSGHEFRETVIQHRDLTGEGWWVVARDRRSPLPLELWPVRPDRMQPVPSATDFIAGYIYAGPDGEKVPLDIADVMMIKMPNPLDPYRGLGPAQAIMVDLDAERYSAEWNRNFFINSAEPGGIIKLDKRLSDDEFDEFRDRWNEQHRGVASAHRVAVLEQGEWIDRKFSQRDMQFTELRRISSEKIREAFGMSKTMLGSAESETNRATAEAAEYVYSKYHIVERLEQLKGVLNNELLPLYGAGATDLEFDYDDPVPENAEAENASRDSRVNAAVALIAQGADAAETLAAFDLPEIPFAEKPEPQPIGAGPPAFVELARRIGALETTARALPASVATEAHDHRREPRRTSQGRRWRAQQLEDVQEDWEEALADLLDVWDGIAADQRSELADQIERAIDNRDLEALAALSVDVDPGTEALTEAMAALTAVAAGRMAEEAADQGVTVDPVPGDMDVLGPFAAVTAALLGSGLAIAAGREAVRVHSPAATGADVAEHVTGYLADQVGVTNRDLLGGALSDAQNAGRIATLRAAPSAAYYGDETLDGNTCVECRKVDGKWLGNNLDEVEEVYPNGGYRACLGRERCRGTVTAVWPPEQVDGS